MKTIIFIIIAIIAIFLIARFGGHKASIPSPAPTPVHQDIPLTPCNDGKCA